MTAANLEAMGNTACHIPKADMASMDKTQFEASLPLFRACENMPDDTRKELEKKLFSIFGYV
jgi:hypothetical protein